jgi:hypothetical protein
MTILQNAVDSISMGIEDYNSSDSRRLVSCTRNIFAGILLLFKHKLAELSPAGSDEVLIKQRVLPSRSTAGTVEWQGQGKKTVDVQQIKDRFESLGISVDWTRVEKINRYRNDIEHYYSSQSHESIKALIADTFIVLRDFVRTHLQQEPLDLLGADSWNTITSVAEVYDREKQECVNHIKAIDWKYDSLEGALVDYRCKKCGSGLIDVVDTATDRTECKFRCLSCGETNNFESMAAKAIPDYFASENHLSIKDGGDPVTIMCPNCGEDTYVLEEDLCPICEESVERECQRCGCAIPPEEIDGSGYCSYCNHMMSKDD